MKLWTIFYLFLIVLILHSGGCFSNEKDINGNNDQKWIDIHYGYGFEIVCESSPFTIIIPTVMNYSKDSIINKNDFKDVNNIDSVSIINTAFGTAIEINSSDNVNYHTGGNVKVEYSDNPMKKKYYLSLEQNESELYAYDNLTRNFHIFFNGSGKVQLKLFYSLEYTLPRSVENCIYQEKYEFETSLKNGWNLYNVTKFGKGATRKYVFEEYKFNLITDDHQCTLIIPAIITPMDDSRSLKENLTNNNIIESLFLRQTEYGYGLEINSSRNVSFNIKRKIDLHMDDYYPYYTSYLSLAERYSENVVGVFNPGLNFYIFKNGSGNVTLDMYLISYYFDSNNMREGSLSHSKYEINTALTNGWNLYKIIHTEKGPF